MKQWELEELPWRPPAVLGTPLAREPWITVSGVPGHGFEVVRLGRAAQAAAEEVLGRGTFLPGSGDTLVRLERAPGEGDEVLVRDVSNRLESGPARSVGKGISVDTIGPNTIPVGRWSKVEVTGVRLNLVSRVLVAGGEVKFRLHDEHGLTMDVPPLQWMELAEVRFVLADGAEVEAGERLFPR